MATLFNEIPYAEVIAGLRRIGYQDELLEENYGFRDYFSSIKPKRQIDAAAFGQTPTSYDSVCIGVARANGLREQALVNQYRALGAPILLEVDNYEVREWAVSRNENEHILVAKYPVENINQMIEGRALKWKPGPLLRDKNIVKFDWAPQYGLFAGLLPELEEYIQESLEPLLRNALATTKAVYQESSSGNREPHPAHLFKLVFWILTAKVFHDRHVNGFISLGADPDEILSAVAKRYDEDVPQLLTRKAREAAVACIWNELDFRHLSVEVLSQMWSTMLVDDETKKRLGIHRTPRTIVRYIVERMPLEHYGDDPRLILEPCSGSAAFLIGIMNVLRPRLYAMSASQRHTYFTNHLAGIEKDSFGVEISHLTLALADFPNLRGWTRNIVEGDVFEGNVLPSYLSRAGIVLCNPPFESFEKSERKRYQNYSPWKPVELLNRVLDHLHPNGVLGFVVPRTFIDGQAYAQTRKRLAESFANIELTVLPDKVFKADTEVGLLVATEPIPHNACRVKSRKVLDDYGAWRKFELLHEVSTEHEVNVSAEQAKETFAVPELPDVWDYLSSYPTLSEVAVLHRGIEWNKPLTKKEGGKTIETGNRAKFVRKEKPEGEVFMRGIAPKTKFKIFEEPPMSYLSLRPEDEKANSFKHDWHKPKAILNKSTKSRKQWRIAAFPDTQGVTFYQTYIGVWPKSEKYDEYILSAILNSPVANAFVATREGKTDITKEILELVPMPYFTEPQRERLRSLIRQYQVAAYPPPLTVASDDPARLLMEIDALILDGYRMPPKLENELLNFFRGSPRPAPHFFGDYLPPDCEIYFSLSEHLSSKLRDASAGELLRRTG
jgi:Type I restriction-modification system methyltransferase subunit